MIVCKNLAGLILPITKGGIPMKNIRRIVSMLLACVMLLSVTAALATELPETAEPFEAVDAAVVAEGIGFTSWGYDMNVLFQEYEDGTVRIYVTCTSDQEGYAPVLITYDAIIEKGLDEDGDPLVTLTINGATMEAALTGESALYDGSTWIDEVEIISNTYDEDSGEYSIPFTYSLSGYTPVTADIDVAPVEEATDPVEWAAQYLNPAE